MHKSKPDSYVHLPGFLHTRCELSAPPPLSALTPSPPWPAAAQGRTGEADGTQAPAPIPNPNGRETDSIPLPTISSVDGGLPRIRFSAPTAHGYPPLEFSLLGMLQTRIVRYMGGISTCLWTNCGDFPLHSSQLSLKNDTPENS